MFLGPAPWRPFHHVLQRGKGWIPYRDYSGGGTTDVELGCLAATICHIGNIAQWLGRPLRWDPDREEFSGDEEANRWLTRAKREPWNA